LAEKCCGLESAHSELERLKEENEKLEKQCNDVGQLETVHQETASNMEVRCNIFFCILCFFVYFLHVP